MPLDERDAQKLGLNEQNLEFLRNLESRTGGNFTVLDLDELQKVILTLNDPGPKISEQQAEIQALKAQINSFFIPSIERLEQKIHDLEKRLTKPVDNYDQRISDLEKVIM
jgi:hypothetical protein